MLILLVFVASFISLFVVTMTFPAMPPGQMLCTVLGNSETDYLIAGISGELLVSGIINGLVWGVLIVMVYSYLRGPSKGKVTLPVWVPGYTTSRSSTIEPQSTKQFDKSSMKQTRKTQDIDAIEEIGYLYSSRLRKLGINTLDELISVCYTRTGQNYLANNIGVAPSTLLKWVHQAQALR